MSVKSTVKVHQVKINTFIRYILERPYNILKDVKLLNIIFYLSNYGSVLDTYIEVPFPYKRLKYKKKIARPKYFLIPLLLTVILYQVNIFYIHMSSYFMLFFTLFSVIMYFVTYPIENRYCYKIMCLLCQMIEDNNFYESEKETIRTEKGTKTREIYKNYLQIEVNIKQLDDKQMLDVVIIRAKKQANRFLKTADSLENILPVVLRKNVTAKKSDNKYVYYYFGTSADQNRIEVNSVSDTEVKNTDTEIVLTKNLKWNYRKVPHALVAGVTGGGKTSFLNYLILEFLKRKSDVYIADPKNSDLSMLKYSFKHFSNRVVSDSNNIARIVREVKEEMDKRYTEHIKDKDRFIYGGDFVDYGLNAVVLIFDEFGSYKLSAEKKVFDETIKRLGEIILKGRQVGVFVIIATQQPNAETLSTQLRDNLGLRVSLGALSAEGFRMVYGCSMNENNKPDGVGTGFIFLDGMGWDMPQPFYAPFLNIRGDAFTKEVERLIEKY